MPGADRVGRTVRIEVSVSAENEELSKYIFGSAHMLTVMAAIDLAGKDTFSTPSLMGATGLSQSTVHSLLTRLKRAGLIRRVGDVSSERIVNYERAVHPAWSFARRLEADARSRSVGQQPMQWESDLQTA